jgi:hypothetical protein
MLSILVIFLLLTVAFLFSPLGLGGGVLYVPILHYLAGWDMEVAILASLTLVWMVAIGSSLAHHSSGHSDIEVANSGRLAAVPGAIIGTILAWYSFAYVSDIVIKIVAAAILIFVIERNLRTTPDIERRTDKMGVYRGGAAFGGVASGLLGIGGGAIYVTLHRSILGIDSRKSAGTSYLIGAVVVPVALFSHILLDSTVPEVLAHTGYLVAVLMPLAALGTAWFGAKYAIEHLSVKMVTTTFLIAVSLSLSRYLWDIGVRIL